MKTILLCVAAMGFTVSVAAAECAGHSKVSASIDSETTVASVQTPATDASAPVTAEEKKAE